MHRPTVDVYDDRGLAWAASHSRPARRGAAEALAAAAGTSIRLDLGCGAGRYAPHLGAPLIGLDASAVMLDACREAAPSTRFVLADVEALPFARRSIGGAWSCMTHLHIPRARLPMALWDLHRVLDVGAPLDLQLLHGQGETDALAGDDVGGRFFASWLAEELVDVLDGAGFAVDPSSVVVDGDEVRLVARREWTLADTVSDGMRLLVCGLNPSPAAADAGVGFARPGNRFWPAALAAGLVERDRDPVHALRVHGVGMTDMVKRTTAAASELRAADYRGGFGRLERLVGWLQPGAVCVVGLAGWRAVVDRTAGAGVQPRPVGGRPVYVMPSTSGLNARTPLDELVGHLRAAAALADGR